ncbi:hypothetical protein BGZ98_009102, partial [Dissophora globulifera]
MDIYIPPSILRQRGAAPAPSCPARPQLTRTDHYYLTVQAGQEEPVEPFNLEEALEEREYQAYKQARKLAKHKKMEKKDLKARERRKHRDAKKRDKEDRTNSTCRRRQSFPRLDTLCIELDPRKHQRPEHDHNMRLIDEDYSATTIAAATATTESGRRQKTPLRVGKNSDGRDRPSRVAMVVVSRLFLNHQKHFGKPLSERMEQELDQGQEQGHARVHRDRWQRHARLASSSVSSVVEDEEEEEEEQGKGRDGYWRRVWSKLNRFGMASG